MNQVQLCEAFEAKVRRGIFRPIGRFLMGYPDGGEDRLQEAVCTSWDLYRRHGLRGDVMDDALLVHACRLKAVDTSRHFVPGDGTHRNCDALSPHAYHKGKVRAVLSVDDTDTTPNLLDSVYPVRNPTRDIISGIDLKSWVAELSDDDRTILEARMAGEDLTTTGNLVGVSAATACRRLRALGLDLAGRCGIRIDLERERRGRPPARSISINPELHPA
jgi:hypothetical protein